MNGNASMPADPRAAAMAADAAQAQNRVKYKMNT